MWQQFSDYVTAKREAKKDRLRRKNAALRAQGKEPLKGWGKMVDSGFGGLNKNDTVNSAQLDNMGFRKHQAEEIGKENNRTNQ
ncbi:hypothetical protein A5886_000997 [Enterococcus sp. 8G7_MSG3316]|uniref:Uncharacterized protein n=1 Tax=Candidatus Enterococcus testudinis TaxID=1834191 RepID=A0A242A5B0_9ENTE|nr:hypothetical protein [Enterococcus sp. 8G7_MSG3316]OTN75921.1 hypothetical protein A5886_000997 [Enterococcus sp. 8G7_MSG3316]